MSNTKNFTWFYEAQNLFKQWKQENAKASECIRQTTTADSLEESHFIYPANGGQPEVFNLHAYRKTGEVYLMPDVGQPIKIEIRKRTDL